MKIFLGYGSEHIDDAIQIRDFIKETGHEVWFDKDSLIPGQDWKRSRIEAQERAQLIIHVCSEQIFQRAGDVNSELRKTLELIDNQPVGAIFAIFMKVNNFRLPAEFNRYQYIEYFGASWQNNLMNAITAREAQLSLGKEILPKSEHQSTTEKSNHEMVSFSDSNDIYDTLNSYIKYKEHDLYWEYVNNKIKNTSLESYFRAKREFIDLSKDEHNTKNEYKFEQSSSMEEFYRKDRIISIRFFNYIDFKGAHPNHYIKTLNFAGLDFGEISIEELLGHDYTNAEKILKYCQKVLSAEFEGELEEDFLETYSQGDDLWRLLAQFSFDSRGVVFNFSPYDVLPYVFGEQEVFASWRFLSDKLDGKFGFLHE